MNVPAPESLYNRSGYGQAGVGLIEVLVALLVFSMGILGLLTVQVAAKRHTYEATQRSVATSLMGDIIERMRANPHQLPAYVVSGLAPQSVTSSANCTVLVCTPAELAAYDLYDWSRLLGGWPEVGMVEGVSVAVGGLVSPLACIANDAGEVTVTVVWQGTEQLTNSIAAKCGEASGLYGSNDARRRLITVSTYIGEL